MVSRDVASVNAYLDALEPGPAEELAQVLGVVRAALPDGLREGIAHGMVGWQVPLERYPDTYNGEPMLYAALAAQRRHLSLYLMPVYVGGPLDEATFRARWSSPKRLDMGRSCIRFQRVADLDVPLIAEALGQFTVDEYIAAARAARVAARR
ncbi:MAG: DUF1801 domain-containing protein [Chloroflexota bacterium]